MDSVRQIPAVDLPSTQEKTTVITKDGLIENALREEGIFPPSGTS